MAEYRLTPAAEKDLEAIWIYTCSQWNAEQANHYVDEIAGVFSDLAVSPYLATQCDDIRKNYRRWCVKSHWIYFRITSYGIEIIRILHGSQNIVKQLKPFQ